MILEQCLEFDPRKSLIKLLKVKRMVYFKYSKYTNNGVTIIFAPPATQPNNSLDILWVTLGPLY